jgi:hypothetical protein
MNENEIHIVRLTTNELRLMKGLLDHCRLGMENDSELRVALHSLIEMVSNFVPEDCGELADRVTFSREKASGDIKVYDSESSSLISIEIL